MVKTILLFILALLPIIYLGYYVYSKDKEKEPKKILFKLFMGGLGSALLTIIFSIVLNIFLPFFNGDPSEYNDFKLLFYTIFMVGFVEEISKFIMVYLLSYHNKEYDELYDMIVYSVFVSLGFAWIENLLYVLDGGIGTAINRLLFAVPTHASVAVFMGYYLSYRKLADINKNKKQKNKYLLCSIIIPTILHGIYDFLAYSTNTLIVYIFFFFTCFLFSKANKKLKEMSNMKVILVNKYCPNCGTKSSNETFCKKCGYKLK